MLGLPGLQLCTHGGMGNMAAFNGSCHFGVWGSQVHDGTCSSLAPILALRGCSTACWDMWSSTALSAILYTPRAHRGTRSPPQPWWPSWAPSGSHPHTGSHLGCPKACWDTVVPPPPPYPVGHLVPHPPHSPGGRAAPRRKTSRRARAVLTTSCMAATSASTLGQRQ